MLNLQRHQQNAYENVLKHFEEGDKSIVVFPTGCGKSFVSLKLMEDNRDEKILFIAPSQPIVNQMLNYICKYLSTEENEKKIEEVEQRKGRKLGAKERVAIILPGFDTVLYQTIISKSKKAQELLEKLNPNYIICDEVHHLKKEKDKELDDTKEDEMQKEGIARKEANLWGEETKKFIDSKHAKVLGITATPERNDGVNVAINLFDEKIASEISLIDALTSDEIPVKIPDYIPCEYTLMDEIDEKSIQEQIEFNKTVNPEKADKMQKDLDEMRQIASSGKGLKDLFTDNLTSDYAKFLGRDKGKYIIFCSSIEDMKQKMQEARDWFSAVDTAPEIYAVSNKYNYSNNSGEKVLNSEKVISEFEDSKSNHLKLLFCVNMLDEGLHVSDISGVVMTRKTNSRIKYLQQLGRGISSDADRPVPIIFDIVNNHLNYNIADKAIEILEKKIETVQKNGDKLNISEEIDIVKEKIEKFKKFKITGKMQSLVDLLEAKKANIHLRNYNEYEKWCITNKRKPKYYNKIRAAENVEDENSQQTENRIFRYRTTFFYNILGKINLTYEEESIKKKYEMLDEMFPKSLSMINYEKYENWCYEHGKKPGTITSEENKIREIKESYLKNIEYKIKDKKELTEEEKQIKKMYEELDIKFNVNLLNAREYKEWCKKNKRLPKTQIIIDGKIVKSAKKGEKESPEQIEQRLGKTRQTFYRRLNKKIENKENLTELDKMIKKIYEDSRIKYSEDANIKFGEKVNVTDVFIEKLEKLKIIGVDLSKIVGRSTIRSLLEKQGIDTEKAIECGLNLDDNIGSFVIATRNAYNGNLSKRIPPTEEQVKKIEENYGIRIRRKMEVSTQSIGQATYEVTVQNSDEANSVIKALVKESKKENNLSLAED